LEHLIEDLHERHNIVVGGSKEIDGNREAERAGDERDRKCPAVRRTYLKIAGRSRSAINVG
jgi:hypothetical protein